MDSVKRDRLQRKTKKLYRQTRDLKNATREEREEVKMLRDAEFVLADALNHAAYDKEASDIAHRAKALVERLRAKRT